MYGQSKIKYLILHRQNRLHTIFSGKIIKASMPFLSRKGAQCVGESKKTCFYIYVQHHSIK